MDFSRYSLSGKYYGGTERKIGISIKGIPYMLKFQKRTAFGNRNNHISEYIGCHIFEYLGFEVQETFLGTYKGEYVVACRDFNVGDVQFVPFNDVGESSLDQDKERYQYDYEDMLKIINSEEETKMRIYKFPTSQIKLHGKKSSYYDVISSLEFQECCQALSYIYNKINIEEIYRIIDTTDFLSEVQKKFYKHILKNRYELIIRDSYNRLEGVI